jgi:acyl carrier protein
MLVTYVSSYYVQGNDGDTMKKVEADDNLTDDLHADSLDITEMIVNFEKILDTGIVDTELPPYGEISLRAFADYLKNKLAKENFEYHLGDLPDASTF